MNIVALFQCLQPYVTATTLRQFSRIALAMLVMTGRVTMLGISRWAGKGGSYRTVQRFFSTVIPWATLFWVFFRQHVYRPEEVYLLAGDEVVVTKAGKHTHGLDRFFASLYGKPVPGLAFFTLSLVSIQATALVPAARRAGGPQRRGESGQQGQSGRQEAETFHRQAPPRTSKGQQEHSQSRSHAHARVSAHQRHARRLAATDRWGYPVDLLGPGRALWQPQRPAHGPTVSPAPDFQAALRRSLYFPYDGPYAGRGPRRKYGRKVDYANMPEQYLKETTVEGHIQTRLYQAQLLHKEFAHPLNVVIIVKTNLRTQAQAHVVLFSSDLALAYAPLVDYYGLRFQIEFNFRDAKQYWGLEDFMNVTPTGVTNAANLSLFMVNVAYRLRADVRQRDPDYSILDLKADCRGYKYVEETIKMLPEKPEPILLAQILNKVAGLGRIHASQPSFSFS